MRTLNDILDTLRQANAEKLNLKVKLASCRKENDELREKIVSVQFWRIMTAISSGLVFYLVFYIQSHS